MTEELHEDARATRADSPADARVLRATLPAVRQRTLEDAGLGAAPMRTFKADRRSHVWLADAVEGRRVIKQFVYSPLRQRLALLLDIHPGRRELACNHRLAAAGVRVVPIVDAGIEGRGLGCRAWLATPLTGSSLHHLLDDSGGDDDARGRLIDAAAALAADLIRAGFWFKDLKPSNIVIDEAGEAWLIDVGSARPAQKPAQTRRMLKVMDRVLKRAGADAALRQRFAASVRQASPPPEPAPQPEAAEAR